MNGRIEATWEILRMFGYGDDLQLKKQFLHPHQKFQKNHRRGTAEWYQGSVL